MQSVVYSRTGGPEVLRLVERELPEVPPGHVRIRVAVSGVNPTDWRSRSGQSSPMRFDEQVPNQDGSGVVDECAEDVDGFSVGQRVWLWDTAYGRPMGTAQEYVVVPSRHVVALPPNAGFDVGASLGIPALTAHRLLTVPADGPRSTRSGRAAWPQRPGAGRCGCGRQRRDPACGVGRGDRHHHRQQRGQS